MAQIEAISRRVHQHWIGQGLAVQPVEMSKIAHSVRNLMPSDFLAFLNIAGLPLDEDTNGFRFWQPEELQIVTTSALHQHDDVHFQLSSHFMHSSCYDALIGSVVFADYLQESWWYSISRDDCDASVVRLVDYAQTVGDLEEFLAIYLRDGDRLYPVGAQD